MNEPETGQADPRRLYADDGTLLYAGEELAALTSVQREKVRQGLQQTAKGLGLLGAAEAGLDPPPG